MNKITPTPSPPLKKIPKNFLKNLFKGVGLATLSLNRYNMAQGLQGRSCFKYVNIEKTTPFPTPTFKKFLIFFMIYLGNKLYYLIIRSEKFANLVTSFFLVWQPRVF